MTSTRKRHQHVVPKVYLRGFADDRQMVSVRRRSNDTGDWHINNVAVRKNFYSFSRGDETQDDQIEDWFATDVEGPVGQIFPRLRSGDPVQATDVGPLALFLACQLMRTASNRRLMEELDSHLGPQMVAHELLTRRGDDPSTMSQAALNDTLIAAHQIWEMGQDSLGSDQRLSRLRTAMRKIDELAEEFTQWTWTVLHAGEPCLITGDAPAVAFEPTQGFTGVVPAGSPVYLPLTPSMLLLAEAHPLGQPSTQAATGSSNGGGHPPLSPGLARMVNDRIALEADDAIINTPGIPWPVDVRLAPTRPSLAAPTVTWSSSGPETAPTFPAQYRPVASTGIRSILDDLGAVDTVT